MEMTLPVLLDLFVATKKTEGKSLATVSWYRRRLSMFFEFLGDQARIADLTVNNARAFVASLQERTTRYADHPVIPQQEGGLSIHYIHSFVRAIKAFGAWLAEEGFVPSHPFGKLKRPKLPETVVDILSDAEITAISQSVNANTFIGARLAVIVSLLLDTGIRAGELVGLTVENVNLDENYIKVKGKGNKERIVPFGNTSKKILLRYLVTFRPKSGNNRLILNIDGEPLTYDALAHLMGHLAEKVAIPRLHLHLFRHTFAVRYLISGGDLMTLKLMLGHTDIVTTQLYLHLAQQHVQAIHNQHSPLDKLNIKFNGKNGV
jgi:site-specific recombinase XerD